jgi:hypothetical protein
MVYFGDKLLTGGRFSNSKQPVFGRDKENQLASSGLCPHTRLGAQRLTPHSGQIVIGFLYCRTFFDGKNVGYFFLTCLLL